MARALAIDLGTANTLVYAQGQDIVYRQPTVIAVHRQTGEVLAMGAEAWRMIGRTPSYIVAHRPLRSGAITDFDMTEQMMRAIFHQVGVNRFNRPRVVICVPSVLTLVEMRAVKLAARRAGAGEVLLMEQPIAAALGANLPIDQSVGNLIVDIGGGTTESALISLGGVVALEAERVGSFAIDDAVQNHLRRHYDMAVGEQTAEKIKITVGSALDIGEDVQMEVRGRRISLSSPEAITLRSSEIREAIATPLRAILNSILNCVSSHAARVGQRHLPPRSLPHRRRWHVERHRPADRQRGGRAGTAGASPAGMRRARCRAVPGYFGPHARDVREHLRRGVTQSIWTSPAGCSWTSPAGTHPQVADLTRPMFVRTAGGD